MNRRTWSWKSPALDREMGLGCWGHFGRPVLLFATAASDFLDNERFLMFKALAPLIDAGRIKVYSIDSVAGDGWLDKDAHPAHKAWLQARFDQYIANELLPFISDDCGGNKGIFTAGASIGAYNAVHAACKHPDWYDGCIAMSGTYDFDRWMHGFRNLDYYFTQPMYYVPNLPEGAQLARLRQVQFLIATGQGRAEAPDESRRMHEILLRRGIPSHLEIWGHDVHHDWPTWRTMLPMFLDRMV